MIDIKKLNQDIDENVSCFLNNKKFYTMNGLPLRELFERTKTSTINAYKKDKNLVSEYLKIIAVAEEKYKDNLDFIFTGVEVKEKNPYH